MDAEVVEVTEAMRVWLWLTGLPPTALFNRDGYAPMLLLPGDARRLVPFTGLTFPG